MCEDIANSEGTDRRFAACFFFWDTTYRQSDLLRKRGLRGGNQKQTGREHALLSGSMIPPTSVELAEA